MSPGYSHINFLKFVERRQHYFENLLHSTKIYIFLSKNIKVNYVNSVNSP